MKRCVLLEPAAEAVCNQSAVPPLIFQLPPKQGGKALGEAQDTPVYLIELENEKIRNIKRNCLLQFLVD